MGVKTVMGIYYTQHVDEMQAVGAEPGDGGVSLIWQFGARRA